MGLRVSSPAARSASITWPFSTSARGHAPSYFSSIDFQKCNIFLTNTFIIIMIYINGKSSKIKNTASDMGFVYTRF